MPGIPQNRIDLPSVIKNFTLGVANGINTTYNNTTKIVSIAIAYTTKNLKIGVDGKLNTIQDIDSTSSPEFGGLKIGNNSSIVSKVNGSFSELSLGEGITLEENTLNVNIPPSGSFIEIATTVELSLGDVVYKDNFPNYIGFSTGAFGVNETALIQSLGEIILTDTLIPNTEYFIDNLNNTKITDTIPSSGWFVKVGIAKDEHTLIIQNPLKIKL